MVDFTAKFTEWMQPPPELQYWEWAEKYRILNKVSSARPGKYRVELTPFVVDPLEILKLPEVKQFYYVSGAQSAKTTMLENVIGYHIHQDPCPILVVLPDERTRDTWSKDRLAHMINDCDVLREIFELKTKVKSETIEHKNYPGGQITLLYPASASAMAMRPIRIVIFDEFDLIADNVGNEGSVYSLALKRSQTFYNRLAIFASTPTIIQNSKIWKLYSSEFTRQYIYEAKCPFCNEYIKLDWRGVAWDDPHNPYYKCQLCSASLSERDRQKAIKTGRWRCLTPDRPFTNVGFHFYGLNSPFVSLAEFVQKFLQAKKLESDYKTFVMTELGEPYDDSVSLVNPNDLVARCEAYEHYIPERVRMLVLAVDTQDDRLECDLSGYTDNDECFTIDYFILYGKPDTSQVWRKLDEIIFRKFRHPYGFDISIACTVIDSSGHYTQQVYDYCESREAYYVFPIKGESGFDKDLIAPRAKIREIAGTGRKTYLWKVRVDAGKVMVYNRLAVPNPGPQYIHFPRSEKFDKAYFSSLTSERLVKTYDKHGFPSQYWENPSKRPNEALDLKCYSIAAKRIVEIYTEGGMSVETLNESFDQYREEMQKREHRQSLGI
jgi:phage terminase large subunit GpA-like protein